MQANAVRIHETGGPEVLSYEAIEVPDPGPGEALVRHQAIGLNFIDVYYRTGLYKAPGLPWRSGQDWWPSQRWQRFPRRHPCS